VKPKQTELIFGNGARSSIVLGLVPLTSLNRSFLWMTELSNSQNVAVPSRTRTNRRLKRSQPAIAPRGDMPISSAHGSQAERKGKRPEKEAYKMKTKTKNEKPKTHTPFVTKP
jgi:hypothetical protein